MAALFGVSAQAEQNQQDMATWLLAKYDLNGDAAITAKEISSKKHKVFLYLDSDQNGAVNIDEYLHGDAKRREAILKARFDKLDLDHNGKVDKEEYSSYLGQFASIDHDGDGNLSKAEVKSTAVAEQPNQLSHCLWVFCIKSSN
jgi:Ca2+-binding EF-hand superfamily protein